MKTKSFAQPYPYLSEVDLVGAGFAPTPTKRSRPVAHWHVQDGRLTCCWKMLSEA